MGKLYGEITPALTAWITAQKMFFVATAPLSSEGQVNCSPKGMDTFRILNPKTVAYLDLTGSGIETIAHLQENGRIVFLFCAFAGPPQLVRLHGTGQAISLDHPDYSPLRQRFPDYPGARAIIRAEVTRISDSCGYSVPQYDYVGDRDTLTQWTKAKGPDGLEQYRQNKNVSSIDGLPGLISPGTPVDDSPQ
ncbi:MAG: pyridoxamine 5'-phosphate oxidase family protein [Elainellaceae cyanobacterium]